MATEEELRKAADDELNTIEVEPEPPETDDEEEELPAPAPRVEGAPPSNAKQRKRERGANYRELQERTERYERELAETRQQLARVSGFVEANARQQQSQQQGKHPLEQELDNVIEEQSRWYELNAGRITSGKATPAEMERYGKEAAEFEKRKILAGARLQNAMSGVGQGMRPEHVQQMAFQQQLNERYPDIAANPAAYEYGGHVARALQAKNGGRLTWEVLDEAAEQTRKEFKMQSQRSRPAPTEMERSRYVSTPKGATPNAGTPEPGLPRITKKQAEMAEAAYPDLPAKKAYQKWYNSVGKKYAGQQA